MPVSLCDLLRNALLRVGFVSPAAALYWGRSTLPVLLTLLFLAVPKVCQGRSSEEEIARNLYRAAKGYYRTGNYAEALAGFQKAYKLSGRHVLLYNVALCQGRLGRAKKAIKTFLRYLKRFPREQREVMGQIAKQRARIRSTFLVVTGGVLGAKIFVNTRPVGTLPLKGRLPVPCETPLNLLVVSKGMRFEKRLTVMAGETAVVSVTMIKSHKEKRVRLILLQKKATHAPKKRKRRALLPKVLWGVGVTLLVGGSATGFYALNRVAKAKEANDDGLPHRQGAFEDKARQFGYITDGALALSVGALALGTLLYYLEDN